jgi:hypothetical protein
MVSPKLGMPRWVTGAGAVGPEDLSVGEIDPLPVGAHVAKVSVHVQQLPTVQELHDVRELPLDGGGLVCRVLAQPVQYRVRDVFAAQHEAARCGGQRFETGTHGRAAVEGGDNRVDVGVFGRDRRTAGRSPRRAARRDHNNSAHVRRRVLEFAHGRRTERSVTPYEKIARPRCRFTMLDLLRRLADVGGGSGLPDRDGPAEDR